MRIISKFKDYYDGVQAYYKDDLKYFRTTTRREYGREDSKPYMGGRIFTAPQMQLSDTSIHYVGFCGQVYPCLRMSNGPRYFFTPDAFHKAVKEEFGDDLYKCYEEGKYPKKYWQSRHSLYDYNKKTATKTLTDPPVLTPDRKALFDVAPVWHFHTHYYQKTEAVVEFNPCLRKLEFFRVFDASSAYQELYMWFSNKCEPNKTIPKVSDEDMLLAKGFDPRFSFRKDKKNG